MYGINTNVSQYYERLQTLMKEKLFQTNPIFCLNFRWPFSTNHTLSKGSLVFALTNLTSYTAPGIIPMRVNTRRLHPKGVPFSGFRYMKG